MDSNVGHDSRNQTDGDDPLLQLICEARAGCPDALGQLVESCRPYLLLIANQEIGAGLKAKLGASDVVQETLMQARRDLPTFRGESREQLLGWLRTILLHEVADTRRHYAGTQKRELQRERSLTTDSGVVIQPNWFASRHVTPSSAATAKEEALALRAALVRLPDDFVNVIRLRSWEQLAWDDVGQQLGRSAEAARKLWARAIQRLKTELTTNESARSQSEDE